MTKKKIPQKAEEVNINNSVIENEEVPFFQVPNSVIDEEGNLTAYELLVYVVLRRYGNRGKAAFPSYDTIVRKAAISRATVARALTGLIEKGYIIKQNRSGSSNVYRVLMRPVSQGDGVVSQGDGLPVSEKDPRKNNLFINNNEREEDPLSNNSQVQKAINYYQQLKGESAAVNQRDQKTLANTIKQHGIETTLAALSLHIKEPDSWTQERGSSLATLNHNLPAYLERIAKSRQQEEKCAVIEAQQRELQEEEERREAQLAEERAAWEALPEEEKQRQREERKRFIEGLKQAANGTQ